MSIVRLGAAGAVPAPPTPQPGSRAVLAVWLFPDQLSLAHHVPDRHRKRVYAPVPFAGHQRQVSDVGVGFDSVDVIQTGLAQAIHRGHAVPLGRRWALEQGIVVGRVRILVKLARVVGEASVVEVRQQEGEAPVGVLHEDGPVVVIDGLDEKRSRSVSEQELSVPIPAAEQVEVRKIAAVVRLLSSFEQERELDQRPMAGAPFGGATVLGRHGEDGSAMGEAEEEEEEEEGGIGRAHGGRAGV